MSVSRWMELLLVAGVLLWQWENLQSIWTGLRWRLHLRRRLHAPAADLPPASRGRVLGHLGDLLVVTGSHSLIRRPESFLMICVITGLGMGLVALWINGPAFGAICGLCFGSLPYMLLRIRLNRQRIRSSMEGDILIRELTSNYRIHGCNMKEAIEVTSATLDQAPNCRRILQDLAMGLNKAYTTEEIQKRLSLFRYSLGTVWGSALTQSIYFAEVYGLEVTEALEDLGRSLMKARSIVEHSRRENSEATMILRTLVPVSYLFSVICACRFFGFTPGRFFASQFGTALGMQWLIILIMMYVGGLLANELLGKEKMDL